MFDRRELPSSSILDCTFVIAFSKVLPFSLLSFKMEKNCSCRIMGRGHLNNGADVRPYVAALLDNLLGSQTLALGPAPGEVGLAGSL